MKTLVVLCLENSEYLLKSSKILFDNKLYGPSLSLAALSIEECGKAFMMNNDTDPRKSTKEFQKQTKSHKQKITMVSWNKFMTGLMKEGIFTKENPVKSIDEYYDRLTQYLKEGNENLINLLVENQLYKMLPELKNLGFYVDVDQKGKFLLPKKTKRRLALLVVQHAGKILDEFRHELR